MAVQTAFSQSFPSHSEHMLQQLNLLRQQGAFTDITIQVGDVNFQLHRCILAAGCSQLQLLLADAGNNLVIKNVSSAGFASIVEYLYTGQLKLESQHIHSVLVASQLLQLEHLEKAIFELLKNMGANVSMPPDEAALSLMRMSQGIGLCSTDQSTASVVAPVLPPTVIQGTLPKVTPTAVTSFGELEGLIAGSGIQPPKISGTNNLAQTQSHIVNSPHGDVPLENTSYYEDCLKVIQSSSSRVQGGEDVASDLMVTETIAPGGGLPPVDNQQNAMTSSSLTTTSVDGSLSTVSAPTSLVNSVVAQDSNSVSVAPSEVTPAPLAILPTLNGNSTVQVTSTPSTIQIMNIPYADAATSVGCDHSESHQFQQTEDIGEVIRIKTERLQRKSSLVKTENSTMDNKCGIKQETSKQATEIAIQTASPSYTVRMKRKRTSIAKTASARSLKGKRKRDQPCKNKLFREPEAEGLHANVDTVPDPEEIKKRPLKKRLQEERPKVRKSKAVASATNNTGSSGEISDGARVKSYHKSGVHRTTHDCTKCGRPFGKRAALQRHLELHNTLPTMFSCHICQHSYPRVSELTQHLRRHTELKWNCTECETVFEDPRIFKKHMASVHHDSRPFHCSFKGCTFQSSRPSNVEKHAVIHSGLKSFTCPQCDKSFAQPNGLQSHIKSCYQKRNYICDFCGQRFNYLQSMKSHRLLHTGEKPYQCSHCSARFADHRNYKRHRRVHERGDKTCRKSVSHGSAPSPKSDTGVAFAEHGTSQMQIVGQGNGGVSLQISPPITHQILHQVQHILPSPFRVTDHVNIIAVPNPIVTPMNTQLVGTINETAGEPLPPPSAVPVPEAQTEFLPQPTSSYLPIHRRFENL